ncbi:putative uncharacterized protein [Firmicutes bacterium CAG:646]|nr:putative uncharacterized protein [Firmicutes bacterium CAG:646]
MAVEEYRDNKVIYHLNIDEEAKNILMYLSSLKTIKINRVIKGTTLVSAFYIFSLAFTLYLFHMSFTWIGFVLSIGFAAFGLSVEKFKKTFIKASINKEEQKMSSERKYLFSKDGVEIVSEIGITHNYWSSFVSKGEIENYIYLIRKDNKVLLINKSVLSENELMMLGSFIQEIETEPIEPGNKMSFIMKILVAATMITAIVSLIYMGIKIGYPLSDGEIFRLWFIRTVPIILLLILQCLNVIWTCVLSGIIKMNKKKSLLKRILLWVVGIIVVLAMALGIFVNMLNDDSEHYNSNGTVIVKTPVWLDEPSYRLYKEKNILVLQFLRSADGIEDIDASITQQEYMAKKYGDLEKELEHQDENKKVKKIEEGYLKIYETYIKDTDEEYRKDYNAKGYSYIVTYEDETQIRYLMYDRDNQEGTKAQYVYYKNIKNTDGSWSMMDAEILDMYQYDYESKEVKDLQKTSW